MLDWLRRPSGDPVIEIAGRAVPLVIRRMRHARRMTLRLAPDGREVRLSIPAWTPGAEALAFARSRRDWLASQLDKVPEPAAIGDGTVFPFRGENLRLNHHPGASRRPCAADGELVAGGPESALPSRLRRWLQAEARTLLENDLADYCGTVGRGLSPLALSNARRRWGSCSPAGEIRINWRLIMAPDMVRRSVVAHEVAHLVHFDHSAAFHHLLGQLFEEDLAQANLWLKRHGPSLYRWFG